MRLLRPGYWQGLLGLLLGLELWNPAVPWGKTAGDVIVLLDDSLSMEQSDDAGAWAQVAAATRLPAGSRAALVRFAAQPVLEVPLAPIETVLTDKSPITPSRRQPLDRSDTRLGAALEFGLRLVNPQRPTALVLISDGRVAQAGAREALELARAAGIPVYGKTPALSTTPDAWIAEFKVPTQVRVGQRLPITVTVIGGISASAELRLRLAGKLIAIKRINLEAGNPNTARLWLEPDRVGPQPLEVTLAGINDNIDANNTQTAIINVNGPASALYLTARPATNAVVASLQAGGWVVTALQPEQFLQARLEAATVIVLDNVAIRDIPQQAWIKLTQAVSRQGIGLLVLGGDRSFGAGAYRHSVLEPLLPVTAEPSEPETPAAVLFVVDQSGSMDRDHNGISRLQLARQAVRDAARMLLPGDQVGLLTFAVEPHLLIPLGSYERPAGALEAGWRGSASGGTQLQPALQRAVTELRRVDVSQRLLVLVTDGFVAAEALDAMERQIAVGGIDVIALAIGNDADLNVLRRLAGINKGRLLHIRDVAELPLLMSEEVGKQRSAIVFEPTRPQQTTPLPFGNISDWPSLGGYAVTKARAETNVYLKSKRGDPLLAAWQAGAGQVVVLPAGLGEWAAAWYTWPHWGPFLGGLIEWCNPYGDNPALQLHSQRRPGELELIIDALDENHDWISSNGPAVWLTDPAGRARTLAVELIAPGRYQAHAPTYQEGRYKITVQRGTRILQQEVLINAAGEFNDPVGISTWTDWLRQGLVRPIPAAGLSAATPFNEPQPLPLRTLLLTLTGLVFLAQLADERGLLVGFAQLCKRMSVFHWIDQRLRQ